MFHVSSFISTTLTIWSAKDVFTQGLWGGLPQRKSSTPLMEYVKDSLDSGQTEDGFSNLKSIKEYRASYSLPDPEQLESSYNLLIEWDPGEKTWKPPTNTMADFKPCGNFKPRLVVNGCLSKESPEIAHPGVVSLRNFRLSMFVSELHNFQLWGADDENAHFQALTKEKLCIVAGPEVEQLQEHVLMHKALNGTRSGRACWHDKTLDILQPMNFL